MRNRRILIAIGVALMLTQPWQALADCSFHVQKTPVPSLVGKLVFASCTTTDCTDSHLYLYDFASPGLQQIDKKSWNISGSSNPVLMLDGKAVLFSAVDPSASQRDLYYWQIGTKRLYTLTLPSDIDEDVKLSSDGKRITWKITDRERTQTQIDTADLTRANGVPTLQNQSLIIGGAVGDDEVSGPTFSPTQKFIYYYKGTGSAETVWRIEVATKVQQQMANAYAFYPVDPDLYEFLYAGWPGHTSPDKIFVASLQTGTATPWNVNDCTADNSDPAPVDEDYFFYSRRDPVTENPRYELYLGQISTGYAWSLDALKINPKTGNALGANYTSAGRVAPRPSRTLR